MKIFDKDGEIHDLDQGQLVNQGIRIIAVLSLLIGSFSVLRGEALYCLFDYYGQNNIVDLHTLTAGISKDPALFGTCDVVALLFLPLLLSYHRAWYAFFLIFFGCDTRNCFKHD